MHIVFLTDNYPPECNAPAIRTHEHAKTWVGEGHKVTIITSAPNFPNGIIFSGYHNNWISSKYIDGIRLIRVKTYMAPNEGIILRTIDYISFMVMSFFVGMRIRDPDIIIATSPHIFTAISGCMLSVIRGLPFIFELRDLWPSSIVAVGAIRNKIAIRMLERLELFLYRRSSAIIAVSVAFINDLVGRGIQSNKIHVITNGVDLEYMKRSVIDRTLASSLGVDGRFTVGYIGTHGMAHALESVLDAASLLQENSRIRFLFIGSGSERSKIIAKAKRMNLKNVIFVEAQGHDQIKKYWNLCNIALISLKDDHVFKSVIPSKLFEAMSMGIPVVASIPKGIATKIIERTGCGIVAPAENPKRLAHCINIMLESPELCKRHSESGIKYSKEYDRGALARDMLTIIGTYVKCRVSVWIFILFFEILNGISASEINIALHRPYTMVPVPDYPLCTDPDDAIQLTDGKYVGSGTFWTQKSAVGWSFHDMVLVTIDLGIISDFTRVIVSTAGRPKAGVEPCEFYIATSNDDISYNLMQTKCIVLGKTSDPGEESRCKSICDVRSRGRWIAIALHNSGPFVFADEISIIKSDQDISNVENNTYIIKMDKNNIIHDLVCYSAVNKSWSHTMDHLLSSSLTINDAGIDSKEMINSIRNMDYASKRVEKASYLRSEIWRKKYGPGLHIWTGYPCQTISSESEPVVMKMHDLNISGISGTVGNSVINMSNASNENIAATLIYAKNTSVRVRFRTNVDVLSRDGYIIGDALPFLPESVIIPPGETKQIWIEADLPDVKTINNQVVNLILDADEHFEIPLNISSYPITQLSSKVIGFNWDYLSDSKLTRGLESFASEDLRMHSVNVHIFPSSALPKGDYDKNGHLLGKLDFSEADRQISFLNSAEQFIWFFGWDPNDKNPDRRQFGSEWMSDMWKTSFREWLESWREHYLRAGLKSSQMIYYPFDEYMGDLELEIAMEIKRNSKDNLIFCIPTPRQDISNPISQISRLAPYVDIWCAHRDQVVVERPSILDAIKKSGNTVWMYECEGPSKSMSPYQYYRLEWWLAFRNGISGVGFWSYNDAGKSANPWDDCDDIRADYSVIYTARSAPRDVLLSPRDVIIPSRRWEAWTQGSIDAKVLWCLKEKISKIQNASIIAESEIILNDGVALVIRDSDNYSLADQIRLDAMKLIMRIP